MIGSQICHIAMKSTLVLSGVIRDFFSYNASKDELKHLKDCDSDGFIFEFLNPPFYAFLLSGSKEISIGNLESKSMVSFAWQDIDPDGLHYLTQSKLLLGGFDTSSVKVFKVNNLPYLRVFCSAQAHRTENIYILQSFCINGKEYVMTSGGEGTLKFWHLIKGRMRLLKVIHTEGK